MNIITWIVFGIGALTMAVGVALVSSRRPPWHARIGLVLFAIGFVVLVTATCFLVTAVG